jgi:hypothetical protein
VERECCVRWPQYIKEKTECVPDISQGTIIKDDAMTLKKKKLNGEENCIITEHGWGKKTKKLRTQNNQTEQMVVTLFFFQRNYSELLYYATP